MAQMFWLDLAPNPVRAGGGALIAVALLIIGFILLMAAGLVVFLWYRKRSRRGIAMIRPDTLPTAHVQPSNPNQL